MKKKKHIFHCQICHSPCMIYKKGRGHRVLVCPEHGVIATNGMFDFISKGYKKGQEFFRHGKGAGVGKLAGQVAGNIPFIGGSIEESVINAQNEPSSYLSSPSRSTRGASVGGLAPRNKLTMFEKALLLERLEKR